MTTKKAAAKKAAPKKAAVKKAATRDTILIEVTTTLLNGKTVKDKIEIVHPKGCMLPHQTENADYVIGSLKAAMAGKFGVNHIK